MTQMIDKEILKSYMHVYVCEKLKKILNFHTLKYNKIKIIIVGLKFKLLAKSQASTACDRQ